MSKPPFIAPDRRYGELSKHYINRLAQAFEAWANETEEPAPAAPEPEPVDPDLVLAREICARQRRPSPLGNIEDAYLRGAWDHTSQVKAALAGVKIGKAQAKPTPLTVEQVRGPLATFLYDVGAPDAAQRFENGKFAAGPERLIRLINREIGA